MILQIQSYCTFVHFVHLKEVENQELLAPTVYIGSKEVVDHPLQVSQTEESFMEEHRIQDWVSLQSIALC
jgi:hypothetical protein